MERLRMTMSSILKLIIILNSMKKLEHSAYVSCFDGFI